MISNEVINKIKDSSKIALSFHTSPDGDSLGSSLALLQGLRAMGKEAYIVSKEEGSKSFSFLPFIEEITGENSQVSVDTDILIVLDCGNTERVNTSENLNERKFTLINVDHHKSNDNYGDINDVDITASSMGERVFHLLQQLNVEITREIATCLYTSLLTDTGSFRHSNTTNVTHKVAGQLISTGIDFSEIHRLVFDSKEFNRVKLLGKAIDSLELKLGERVGVIKITDDIFTELNLEDRDTSDIVNVGMKVQSVEVMVLLKESEEGIKTSIRSKKIVDVSKVAQVFGGGGHVRAAGAKIEGKTLEEAEKLILAEIEKELI